MKRRFTILTAAFALLAFLAIPMGVWGQTTTTDVINHDATVGELGSTANNLWKEFNLTGSSGAMYHIRSMGTKDGTEALRWNANGYLYMTRSSEGKKLKSITITTAANKNIGIYASNTAYSSAPSGNALYTLEATSSGATYTFTSDFTYLALKGTASSTLITNITIEWEQSSVTPTYTVTYNANGGSGEMIDENSPYEANVSVYLLENTFTAPEGMIWSAWQVKDVSNNTISVSNNQFTMPASDVTVTAQWVADPNATQYEWVLTDLADLTSSDIFVIVGNNGSNYAMTNNNGTASAPAAFAVTIANERITSIVSDVIKWNISGNANNGYVFYPNGDNEKWLYCTNTNNGVRVGTNNNKTFAVDATSGYLKHVATSRYVGIYNSEDWRCYTATGGNIANQTFAFYKRQVVSTDPYITADDVELEYDDTEGTITYVLHNATGNITATATAAWITNLTPNASTSTVAIACEANNSNEPREATVVLAYGEATKDVTVTQAANPNAPLTTMDEIFARATEVGSTATDVTITFNNWVVTGANNSAHTFVSDGTKGFMIYGSEHGFAAGNILSGTVQCKVQLFNGAAEITNLTNSTTGLNVTTGGNVTVADIAMADLAAINTGALVSYENLTCSVTTSGSYTNYYLTDGTTQIQAYSTLYSGLANSLEDGKTYNITGVFVKNNSTKRVNPRNASDIVEVVTPVTSDKYVKVTSATDLTSGQYLIVYEEGSVAFNGGLETLDAANNTIGVVIGNNEIAFNTTTAASEFTIDITAGTIKSASGYYIGRTSNSNGMDTDQETAYTNTISIDGDGNAVILASGGAYLRYNATSGQDRFRYFKSSTYTDQNAIQLYKKVSVSTKHIGAYGTYGYYLISSPIGTVDPQYVTNMKTDPIEDPDEQGHFLNTYDLYRFDQAQALEWRNYRKGAFNLEVGKGYLYGNSNGVDLVFTGTAYDGDGTFQLVKVDEGDGLDFPGWNLVGNPFATEVVEIKDENENTLSFYTMTADGRHIISATNTTVQPMEGVFVVAEEDGEEITFTPTEGSKGSLAALNLSDGNEFVDRAIVRFGQGRQLPKLQLDRNSSKLYIPQDGQDYAVVYSEEMGAMPVNFKAENNGTYCLNLSSENVEFAYLHLIDNMTGNDIDLLKTPSYSFEAKTTDYESRFKLVFATGDNSNDDTFAFYSNGSFVINNEGNAELQVIDITGRIVKSESINGCANVNVNAAPGVYMLRLVNGDNVKVQKVVVK